MHRGCCFGSCDWVEQRSRCLFVFDQTNFGKVKWNEAQFQSWRIGLESKVAVLGINEQRINRQAVSINSVGLLLFEKLPTQLAVYRAPVNIGISFSIGRSR